MSLLHSLTAPTSRPAWAILGVYFALICGIALSHIVPLTSGEASSFLEISRHGIGFATTTYPDAGNHIAFSALQALVARPSLVVALPTLLRLPNLVCVFALLALLLHLARSRLELSNSLTAALVIALSLCSPLITLYLFVGRGYLLGAALLLAAVHLAAIPGRRVATALLCALATWTAPSFAFATPGVFLALLGAAGSGRLAWKIVAQSVAVYALATCALYSPVIGDVLSRNSVADGPTSLAFASAGWNLLGNSGAFGLAIVGNTLLLALLALGLRRGDRSAECLAFLAPVASYFFVVGLLAANGITAGAVDATGLFAPLFVWLALVIAVRGSIRLERSAGVLIALNVCLGALLFTTTLATGDPQQYPMLASLDPSPLARADRSLLSEGSEVRMERNAVPVGKLYARGYGFHIVGTVSLWRPYWSSISQAPCAKGGRYPPRSANRVEIASGEWMICF